MRGELEGRREERDRENIPEKGNVKGTAIGVGGGLEALRSEQIGGKMKHF